MVIFIILLGLLFLFGPFVGGILNNPFDFTNYLSIESLLDPYYNYYDISNAIQSTNRLLKQIASYYTSYDTSQPQFSFGTNVDNGYKYLFNVLYDYSSLLKHEYDHRSYISSHPEYNKNIEAILEIHNRLNEDPYSELFINAYRDMVDRNNRNNDPAIRFISDLYASKHILYNAIEHMNSDEILFFTNNLLDLMNDFNVLNEKALNFKFFKNFDINIFYTELFSHCFYKAKWTFDFNDIESYQAYTALLADVIYKYENCGLDITKSL